MAQTISFMARNRSTDCFLSYPDLYSYEAHTLGLGGNRRTFCKAVARPVQISISSFASLLRLFDRRICQSGK